MLDAKQEILADIEQTLEQLTENSVALKMAQKNHAFSHEVEHLKNFQESLLARLIHKQSLLDLEKREEIRHPLRKDAIEKKELEYRRGQKKRQKPASLRRARSKS